MSCFMSCFQGLRFKEERVSGGATLLLDKVDLAAEAVNQGDTETLDAIKAGAVEVCENKYQDASIIVRVSDWHTRDINSLENSLLCRLSPVRPNNLIGLIDNLVDGVRELEESDLRAVMEEAIQEGRKELRDLSNTLENLKDKGIIAIEAAPEVSPGL
jgi:hypothetical protein